MNAVIVIPARFGSKRLPGKPLALINNKSLLYRTWSIAKAINHVSEVYIATDDNRISDHAHGFGGKALMTPESCLNGTERVLSAIEQLHPIPEVILNLQGDAVLTPPWVIQSLIDKIIEDKSIGFATIATQLSNNQYDEMLNSKANGRVGGTTVVFNNNGDALYFSKNIIPFLRNRAAILPVFRHIGLYVYRYPILKKYVSLEPTLLEVTEGLEQLRALENGIPIKVVKVDYRGRTHWAIDSQEDIRIAEKIIQQEGELLNF